ncbi:MAG TPA: hypothetical protein VM238_22840 [Phycisphaerae bacterium]|nr:hypothetical protein [Phycisphaerae bacterium]
MIDAKTMVCANCCHVGETKGGLECWREPPRAAAVPIMTQGALVGGNGQAAGSLNWLVKAVRPPVRPDETCGDFEFKCEMLN